MSFLSGSMVIDTLTNGSVATSLVCLKCPLTIYATNLVCLQLSQVDVILGMKWLELNLVHIKIFAMTVIFPKMERDRELMFISAKQVEEFLIYEAHVFAMFASLGIDSKVVMGEIPIVCDFPEVFPNDISDFPPEREVEFAIDLVSGTSISLRSPYRMLAS
ncbi:uncharacterized protein LOC127122545 [Lathyrus oleraceus]|uniref:uncharacterized protein LOC127122545 n=1 Tax=Pisum sativum TaxID=3888 RepID=UPI0021D3D8DD|nr:uncharacterized protein LOC127122545 [Pisum sativum]